MAFTTYIGKVVPDEDSVFYSSFMKDDENLFSDELSHIIDHITEGEVMIETIEDGIFISGNTNDRWMRISKDGSIEFGMPG